MIINNNDYGNDKNCEEKIFKSLISALIMARKITGGKYRKSRKKKLFEIIGKPRTVRLGKEKKKKIKIRGGKIKTILLSTDKANILVGKKCKIAKILTVKETPSNKFLARQNILVKGAIIETELGRAKITNKPGQEGQVNAILLEPEKK